MCIYVRVSDVYVLTKEHTLILHMVILVKRNTWLDRVN